MRRSVRRKRLKVIGLVLCFMMLGLWFFSVLFASQYETPSGRSIRMHLGYVAYFGGQGASTGWTCRRYYPEWKHRPEGMPWSEFAHTFLGFRLPYFNLPSMFRFPVWLLVVTVGLPTGILWWRDRRPKAGFCKVCKYDLTGNLSGTCPECGAAIEHAGRTNDATTSTEGA